MIISNDCVVSTCSTPTVSKHCPPPRPPHLQLCLQKLSALACHRDRLGLWTGVCHPPSTLLTSEIKQTFLSTNLACLLAFEQRAASPWCTLLVTLGSQIRNLSSQGSCVQVQSQQKYVSLLEQSSRQSWDRL